MHESHMSTLCQSAASARLEKNVKMKHSDHGVLERLLCLCGLLGMDRYSHSCVSNLIHLVGSPKLPPMC